MAGHLLIGDSRLASEDLRLVVGLQEIGLWNLLGIPLLVGGLVVLLVTDMGQVETKYTMVIKDEIMTTGADHSPNKFK